MFDGIKVMLGKQEYVVPALTLKQLRTGGLERIRENDQLLTDGKAFESFVPRLAVIGMALRRNYPELMDEELEDLLDMRNINPIWMAVLGASDLAGQGGEVASGDPTISGPSSAN